MLFTKKEVKMASKKLLSLLLSLMMIVTSVSVCFGTFVASAEEVNHIKNLADTLKDEGYANTISLIADSSDTGSGVARKLNITFSSYINYKQAAEILRLVDSAMKASDAWAHTLKYNNDQQSACEGRTTQDVYNELIKKLAQNGVGTDDGTNVQKLLRRILTWDGAKLHSDAVKSSSQSTWTNAITFSTSDYKGYLAQVGKAANVVTPVELGVSYTITMPGNLYYGVAGSCGSTTKYYHNMFWPKDVAINAPASSTTNTEMKSKVDAHVTELNGFINMTYAQMLDMSATELDAKVTELNTSISNAVTYCGSQATYDSLYADYAAGIANFRASVESAKSFQDYMPTVNAWNDFVDANPNYGVFNYGAFGEKGSATQVKLLEDFATFKAYRDYLLTGGSIYDYLVDYNYIDETYYTNFFDNVVAYDLQDSKDAADALYVQYVAVNPENENKYSYEESLVAYNAFAGYVSNIANYSDQVVAAVYNQGYQYLIDMREFFKCEINEAVMYFAENAYKNFATVNTTSVIAEIETAKAHQTALDALYSEVVANSGTDKADQILSVLRSAAAAMIEGMYQTLAERFTAQVSEADRVYTELKRPTKLDMVTYLKLSVPILALEDGWDKNYHPENYDTKDDGTLNTDNDYHRGDNGIIGIQDVLDEAGKGSLISNATRTTWQNFINAIYETWLKYGITYGFADYVQSQIQYADRTVMEGDELKTVADPVTEAEMLKLIEALDKIITSDTVGNLLGGLLGAAEGEDFDLGAMLTDLIKGALFTDDFINTVVQMLYPLVVTEFDKVWAGLPTSIKYSGIDVTVRYKKTLNNILEEGKFEIFPDLLAKKLESLGYSTKYADNIAKLKAAGGESDSWESPKLVDYETGKLMLSWGVAEQKEKLDAGEITQAQFDKFFYDAFEDATSGLLPLLTTLITNKAWTPAQCDYIATGQAAIVTLNVDVELGSTANHGYANLLVPIYELLGVPYTAVSTIESSTYNSDISYVLEQILAPIFTFLGKLGDAPVATILEILPDVVYALTFRMVKPLLNMLNTSITYDVDTNVISNVLNGGALIEVGNMLITDADDAVLPNSMFTNGINSVLQFFGLNIPAIDQNTLATLGELTTMSTTRLSWIYDNSKNGSGKAYTIKADKADVGYFLLNYVLNIVKDPASLSQLLGIFMTQKDENGEAIKDADGKSIPDTEAIAALQETMYADDGLNLDEINIGNAIAAIVELANQPEYLVDGYSWYAGENSSPVGTAAAEIYLNPNNDWTEDKADYLYNNIDELLTSILTMAGVDFDAEAEGVQNNLGELLGGLIDGLLGDKTLTALAGLLAKLDLETLLAPKDEAAEGEDAPEASEPEVAAEEGEEEAGLNLAEILTDLLKNELGIDLSVFTAADSVYAAVAAGIEADPEYVHNFGVDSGDKTFAEVLATLLAPAKPLLDFILGGKDLTLINSAITLQGYKGYDNALIPLLEALGATPAAYTDGADTLKLTVEALVARIEALTTGDVVKNIIDLLPGVIYYISSNGLSQGIDKLLTPVYAILDTIRPIYNISLNDLLAGIEIGEEGNKKPLGLDLKNISWSFIFGLLNDLLGLDLSALQQVIYDVCDDIGTTYTSASALNSTWKKGAYNDNFSAADMLTVVLSFVLEWATVKDNADKLDELLKTDGLIAKLGKVFEDVEIAYGTPNWMYWFESEEAFNAYLVSGEGLPNTLAALEYPSDNKWDLETAEYFSNNLGALVDIIIGLINKDKADAPQTLSALLSDLVNGLVNAETVNELVGMITGLLENVDENLIETAGYLLDIDLVGLKSYTCEAEIDSVSDFIGELADVLDTYAGGLVNWLFFGDDYRFAKKSDKTDTIVINGGLGYEKGLAMLLEALGCELPDEADTKSVLNALAARVDEILADPVDEVIELFPNLVYFLNANGAGVAVGNILAPVNALLAKLAELGLNVNLNDLIGIDLSNLSLENVVTIVEDATGLKLDAAESILVNFCTGKISKSTYGYKMEADKKDVVTILLVVALELVSDKEFAAKLDEMLGTDFVAQLMDILANYEVVYTTPDWNYMNGMENDGVIEYVNAVTSYPNDWTEEKAKYLANNLPVLVDTVIKMVEIKGVKYDSLAELLQANVNVFTTETLNSLLDLIKNLLVDIDDTLLGVGVLLDVDIVGLKNHSVPEGIDTVGEFADELANILTTYAKGVVEWLLLGKDIKLLVKDADGIEAGLKGDAYITIKGANGYAEGLALLLEALGCENLPEVYDVEAVDTEATVKAVLASLAARIDEIFANPVEEVFDLLPNIVYFLDANGVNAVINNTAAAVFALIDKLSVFGIELDVNSLVDLPKLMGIADKYVEGDDVIALNNLTLRALLKAVSLMVDLDLTALEEVLVPFAIGEAVLYDSVSAMDAYKMVYAEDYDKHDMITVIVSALLVAVQNEDNAAKLDEMLGTEIISALKDVFAEVEISYAAPDWKYPLAENGTVDAMKYSITYPNNWTEETAKYVAELLVSDELDSLIAGLIDSNYASLGDLLGDKVNVFTSENLQAVVDLIANLLKDIDDGLLDAAGVLLGADVVGLKSYTAPEGITTVDAFASELANVLNTYAKGVVEWLLFGDDFTFFVKEVKDGAPVDMITINGAHGYAEGLALLLEALGCENLPEVYDVENLDTEATVKAVLASLAARIDDIFTAPIAEVVEILPNLFYFLNTNGVAAVVNNTLAAVTALLEKLSVFGLEIDIKSLVNLKSLMGIEDTDAKISLDNLTMDALLEAVSYMVDGLDLTLVKNVLVGFGLGQVNEYESVSASEAYKMTYADEFDVYDMVTVIANIVVLLLADEDNAEFVEGLVGGDIYAVITNIFNMSEVPVQEFNWLFTGEENNKVGQVVSALNTSEMFEDYEYGTLYTEDKAQYIADNFGLFVDNIIYLLGININGQSVDNLTELLNGLLDGSLYTSKNIIAVRDALAGVLSGIVGLEVNGKNVGKYIAEVLKTAGIADLAAVAEVEVPEFTESREQFVTYLCAVLEPLYGVLKFVLADKDISLFVKEDMSNAITLKGAEGYAYGIIPVLEVLECNSDDILTPEEYYAAVEADGSVLLTSILDPLFDRVDEILADPANEVLAMLSNLIYFINSNGVDTVVKNTLNAVYGILNAIAPVAKIDLYELIGLDLSTLTFEKLFDMLLDLIADSTGYEFSSLDVNAIAELSVGTLEEYTSKNGKTAYKMVYTPDGEVDAADSKDLVLVVERLLLTFIMHENNREKLIGLLKDNLGMTEDGEKFLRVVLDTIAGLTLNTKLGMDTALVTIYYLYYGLDIGSNEAATGIKDLNAEWTAILKDMTTSNDSTEAMAGKIITDILDWDIFDDIVDPDEGVVPNGFIAFFQKISNIFKSIIDWFKNLFS